MATTPTKIVFDCATGIQTEVPLTEEEIAQMEIDRVTAETRQAEREAEEQAKAEAKASALAKLTALGLSDDEAKAIVG